MRWIEHPSGTAENKGAELRGGGMGRQAHIKMVRFTTEETRWVVRRDWYERLAPEFFRRLSDGKEMESSHALGVIVKENPVRRVLRMELAGEGGGLFIKIYWHSGAGEAIKHLAAPSKGRMEWRNSRALEKRGIPTSEGVGYGEKRRAGILKASYYLTNSIEGGVDLERWWGSEEGSAPQNRSKVIEEVGRLVRALHGENFFPSDLHLSNLILRRGKGGEHELYLVDLHSVRRVLRVKRSHRVRNLVQLNGAAWDLTKDERLRLLRSYAGEGEGGEDPGLRDRFASLTTRLEELTEQYRELQFKRRLKRCLKGKYIFGKWKRKGLTVFHRRDFEAEAALGAIADYREAHAREGVRFIKTERSRTVLTLPLRRGKDEGVSGAGRICLKHYRHCGFLHSLKDVFRMPRGRRSWVGGNALVLREVLTCRPLALVEVRRWGLLKESFLLMEDLSGLRGVEKYVLSHFDGTPSDRSLRRRFGAALAESVLNLHRLGIYHGDLKSSNILVEEVEGGWRFYYIDLDGVKVKKGIPLRRRAKNLAQLETSTPDCIPMSDRMRFLNYYLRGAKDIADEKEFLRMVMAQARGRDRIW